MLQVFVTISQKFYCREETWVMQKLFIKKREEEESIRKNGQVSEILKQSVLRCPPEKKEMNKIAPAL